MIDLRLFRKNADKDGLCSEFADKWDKCKSLKQLVDLGFGIKGIDYLCDSIAKGWGLSPQYMEDVFGKHYLNGEYIYDNGKYTSAIYCRYDGHIVCTTTALAIIESKVHISVPSGTICEIYATGNTELSFSGGGIATVFCYGNDVKVTNTECMRIHIVNKSDKDHH